MLMRVWVGLLGTIAVGSGLQCFLNKQYPFERIYTLVEQDGGPALQLASRLFGTWTILAGLLRIAFAVSPTSKSLCVATLLSFLLAFAHFASEVFVYGTADLTAGTVLPLVLSAMTAMWMVVGWPLYLTTDTETGTVKKQHYS